MIDIHSHLLPGIDDGAKDLEEALDLARQAEAEGISHLLVTPHHKNRVYTNVAAAIEPLAQELQTAIDEADIELTIFPGQEVRIHKDLMDSIRNDDVQFLDLNERYILLELPTRDIPEYTEDVIYELTHRGITPIIAHPERNRVIQEDPNKMLEFIDQGCLGQLTAGSYVGTFGDDLQAVSYDMLAHDLVHVIASDAHSLGFRNFYMKDAFEKLAADFGDKKASQLNDRARNIVNGDVVTDVDAKPIEKKKSFFSLFQ